jgi:hypothetical protein
MESDQIILSIITVIISMVASMLTARLYGPRWAELAKARREHSKKLNDEVFKPWKQNWEKYCKVDITYSKSEGRLVGREPTDPRDLQFFEEATSHLQLKYQYVLDSWEELKRATLAHNKELATLSETLQQSFADEMKMPISYSSDADQPESYVCVESILRDLYQEISWAISFSRKINLTRIKIVPCSRNGVNFYELEWNGHYPRFLSSKEKEDAEKCLSLIKRFMETPDLKDRMQTLVEKEKTILSPKRTDFEEKIGGLIKSVELGNTILGKCHLCPKRI